MSRDSGNNREMRSRIAHLAARLIAVDGIDDFALAKRKAARQIGAPDTHNLPNNEEVEQALRAYRNLYQADEQQVRLLHLRRCALEMMRVLEAFNPYLSGSVVSGHAGKYADIDIHLFTDSMKDVEMFLLSRKIPYRSREKRVYVGNELRGVPSFSLSNDDADFEITVFDTRDLRAPLRASAEGRPFDRASVQWLESALAEPAASQALSNPP